MGARGLLLENSNLSSMYYINYPNGAIQVSHEDNLSAWVNLVGMGGIISVIDVKENRALLCEPGTKNVGWAPIPEWSTVDDKTRKMMDEKTVNRRKEIERGIDDFQKNHGGSEKG